MNWTILEVLKVIFLIVLATGLHQLIRHFGKGFVAEIFETTPSVGRRFIILADFAYYLIFDSSVKTP